MVVFLATVGLMHWRMPMYGYVRIGLAFLFFVDYFIWAAYRKSLTFLRGPYLKTFLYLGYFLPFFLLCLFCAGLCFRDIYLWPAFIRTYLLGIILVLLSTHLCYGLVWSFVALYVYLKNMAGGRNRVLSAKCRAFPHLAAFLLLILFVYAMVISTFDLRIDRIDMRQANPGRDIPEGLRGYKILQFSDLHIGSFTNPRQIRSLVRQALTTRPDMIVFTGDMVNFSTSEMTPFLRELSHLQAPDGVYCILGNHDYGNYVEWPDKASKYANVVKMLAYYQKLGWVTLNNASVKIGRGGDTLRLVGVENWGKGKRFPKRGKLSKAMEDSSVLFEKNSLRSGVCRNSDEGFGRKPESYTVLLSHDPSHFDSVVYLRYPKIDLTLSGHTHGMQMGVRINGRDYSPARLVYEHYSGLYLMANGQALYVNTGCGFNGIPFRLGMRPNMTLFVL